MKINIIGAGSGQQGGYAADGYKLGINYWHHSLDALLEIHAHSHPFHAKLADHRANAELVGCDLITADTFNMPMAMEVLGTDYFGSSLDWALAWVMLETVCNEVHIWGCCYSDAGDHLEKRAAADYWIGRAEALGIQVTIHGNSTLKTTQDGLTYGTFTPMKRKYLTAS